LTEWLGVGYCCSGEILSDVPVAEAVSADTSLLLDKSTPINTFAPQLGNCDLHALPLPSRLFCLEQPDNNNNKPDQYK
jgi:hypothetical protein